MIVRSSGVNAFILCPFHSSSICKRDSTTALYQTKQEPDYWRKMNTIDMQDIVDACLAMLPRARVTCIVTSFGGDDNVHVQCKVVLI
eukprot:m.73803 g.73803  ORF g.73803 m.73803 type:complete len:87 (+) comp12435_c0_seq4:306-566(+)